MRLSVLIPVYNERATIHEILRQVQAVELGGVEREVVVVDDGSTDGTGEVLAAEDGLHGVRAFRHERNRGKGAAVQTALRQARGDVLLIQDADLEYDPQDYPRLLRPILGGKAQVVYGSRFLGEHKAMYFWHALGNKLLTLLTNVLYDTTLSDMETGFKVFTREVAGKLRLRQPRWGFDPEITSQILRRGYRIYEVPISYYGREYHEGKKITWRDTGIVLLTLLRCRLFDHG
ncbi:MAG: glycosyltransferase family 2 protein [Chloroflexi bacterium]|nr:glycosyltransferase family 2 protein [Chloroflexota bacterium]